MKPYSTGYAPTRTTKVQPWTDETPLAQVEAEMMEQLTGSKPEFSADGPTVGDLTPGKVPFSTASNLHGDLIYAYTRKEAIEDGHQIELTEFHGDTVREAGIKFRLFCTSTVYLDNVCPIEGEGFTLAPCQDAEGRLWDVLTMLVHGIRGNRDSSRIHFSVMVVPNVPDGSRRKTHKPKRVCLLATCGPVDIDDPAPAITIMYPGEE